MDNQRLKAQLDSRSSNKTFEVILVCQVSINSRSTRKCSFDKFAEASQRER